MSSISEWRAALPLRWIQGLGTGPIRPCRVLGLWVRPIPGSESGRSGIVLPWLGCQGQRGSQARHAHTHQASRLQALT